MRLAAIVLLLSALVLRGEDLYVAQTAQGGDTGADAANAHSAAWFNTAGNWGAGAGKVSAGDAVHLCGTITTALTIGASGSPGSPITILFESGAKLSSALWSSSGALIASSLNCIVIDGNGVGIVENTGNGDGLANSSGNTVGVMLSSCSNAVVKNLTVQNLYQRTNTSTSNGGSAWGIRINAGADITVYGCTIHDIEQGICSSYAAGNSNFNFYSNTIYRVNIGITCSDNNSTATLTNLQVWGNHIYSFTNWNDTGANAFHHNAVYSWNEQNGTSPLQSARVYGNVFGPGLGGAYQTSEVYFSGDIQNVMIYDNLFLTSPGEQAASGLIYLLPFQGSTQSIGIYNNTFIAGGAGACINMSASAANVQTCYVTNNLGTGNGGGSFITVYNSSANLTFASDYNLAYGFNSGDVFSYSTTGSGNFKTWAQWQALGYDAHGVSTNPNLDANYIPQVGSPAIDAAASLTSLFSTDITGATRPSSWDIGAYEYTSGAPATGGQTIGFSGSGFNVR